MRALITTANLIVGKDGSTSLAGSSIGLSTEEDRKRFIEIRSKNDLILIGGNTARREPYKRTPIPLYILTHTKVRLQPKNQLAKQFTLTPKQMLEEISQNFNQESDLPINLLVEAGPDLLQQMIDENLIDYLYLTINQEKQGEHLISITNLTSPFKLMSSQVVSPCEFRHYQKIN